MPYAGLGGWLSICGELPLPGTMPFFHARYGTKRRLGGSSWVVRSRTTSRDAPNMRADDGREYLRDVLIRLFGLFELETNLLNSP
mmetsp:Transcript_28369/g.87773  ORF Transcript_28369/g.87773 Transcript_28369/m.87773 type:complete len:85 (-) Transcript_28369:51-305(-)